MVTSLCRERKKVGRFSGFPVRVPFGKMLGIVGVIVALWVAWQFGKWQRSSLENFYLKTYWVSAWDAQHWMGRAPRHQAYLMVLDERGKLVDQATLETLTPREVQVRKMQVDPRLMNLWLRKAIYGVSQVRALLPVAMMWAVLSILCLTFGTSSDMLRQREAQYGRFVSGTRAVSRRTFNRLAGWKKSRPGITFRCGRWPWQKLHIAERFLSYHIGILGATGRGKTNKFKELLKQIEERGETAIIVDTKGEMLRAFYTPERGDVVFDPTDDRCCYWKIEEEAKDEAEATSIGEAFFPDQIDRNPFFRLHPRNMLAYLLSKYSVWNTPEDPATCAKIGLWLGLPLSKEILPRLKGSEHFMAMTRISDQTQGLQTSLGEVAKPLRMMPALPDGRQQFSVREFLKKRRGWIFLTSRPNVESALRPLHSALLDMLILGVQGEPAADAPRTWFILDEVATLQRLPTLTKGAVQMRSSGCVLVLGIHDEPQLQERYGDKGAATILGQPATNLIFQTEAASTARSAADLIGKTKIERIVENRPVHPSGRHSRGRSWNSQQTEESEMTAADVQSMPIFDFVLKHQGRIVYGSAPEEKTGIRTQRVERQVPLIVMREDPAEPAYVEAVRVDDIPPPPAERPANVTEMPRRDPLDFLNLDLFPQETDQ